MHTDKSALYIKTNKINPLIIWINSATSYWTAATSQSATAGSTGHSDEQDGRGPLLI